MNKVAKLFFTFLKIGLFTFGGGYAMISVIENNCVEKKKWISHEEMMDITVIAESTPGPIAINCATFVGYKICGFFGALFATLGVVIPSFVIILIISSCLDNFLDIPIVKSGFSGIKVGVGVLILSAGINMLKNMSKNIISLVILSVSFTSMLFINIFAWDFSTISMMLIAAFFSFFCYLLLNTREDEEK